MYRCLLLRGKVKLGPRPAGGQGVNDLQVVRLKHQERDLVWPQHCGRRVVVDLTKPVE